MPDVSSVSSDMEIHRAGSTKAIQGPAEWFTGRVRIDRIFTAPAPARIGIAVVNFEPGARTNWHTHPLGQALLVTDGVGWTQCENGPKTEIRSGDLIWCNCGRRHSLMIGLGIADMTWSTSDDRSTTMNSSSSSQARSMSLSEQQKSIVVLAALAAAGDMPRLSVALDEALETGLTISEIREVLVQLYAYAGFPRSLNALAELMRVVDARKTQGITDEAGRGPSRPIPEGNDLLAAGTANQTQLSGSPVEGPLFDFAPLANLYLRTHLFGDIFERDNLDWQTRELATVGMLSALTGVEPQLQAHMRISMNTGITLEQLQQLCRALGEQVDVGSGERAAKALDKHLATSPSS